MKIDWNKLSWRRGEPIAESRRKNCASWSAQKYCLTVGLVCLLLAHPIFDPSSGLHRRTHGLALPAFQQSLLLLMEKGTSGGDADKDCTPASGYAHCRALIVDHTQVGGSTLTNYPLLVRLSLGAGKIQNASCFDVILSSDSEGSTKIPWEQEAGICNPGTGAFSAWVLCTACSNTVDTVLYVSYGNSGIVTSQNTGSNGPTHVYDANFGPVYHLEGASVTDSTSGAVNAVNTNVTGGSGSIGGGAVFNGANAYMKANTWGTLSGFTVSAWINWSNITGYQYVLNGDVSPHLVIGLYNTSQLFSLIAPGGGSSYNIPGVAAISPGTWYHVFTTYDGSNLITYLNGVPESALPATGTVTGDGSPSEFGGNHVYGYLCTCTIDEFRFSNTARPPGWAASDYKSQKPGSTFITVGSEH